MNTLGDLLAELEEQSPLTDGEVGVYGDRDRRVRLLNRGQEIFASRVNVLLKDMVEFQTVEGVQEYNLRELYPAFIDINPDGSVVYDGTRLKATDVSQLNRDHLQWRKEGTGTPFEYYLRDQKWLGLRPTPDTTDKDVEVWVFCRPTMMTDMGDVCFNGDEAYLEYDEAPLNYALWKLWSKVNVQMRDRYKRDFDEMVALARGEVLHQRDVQPALRPMVYNIMRLRRAR